MTKMVFLAVPLFCLICSLFLFLAVLSAKKSKLINSFLALLACFVLWTGGSVLMRLDIYPSMLFWYYVSATGIFCVPYCLYNFLHFYTNRKGSFLKTVFLLLWIITVILNLWGLFIKDPQVITVDGANTFTYQLTFFSVIPAVLAAITIFLAVRMVYLNIRKDGAAISAFMPIFVGIIVMFLGLLLQAFFNWRWLSTDTIFCGVNAICIYYALYKKRTITLTSIASNGPIYLMTVAFTTLVGMFAYPKVDEFLSKYLSQYESSKSFIFVLFFSVTTVLLFSVLHFLTEQLFIKGQEAREKELACLSNDISTSLDIKDTLEIFKEFLITNADMETAYICVLDESGENYRVAASTLDITLKNFTLSKENPLVDWLKKNNHSITYHEFCRTKSYRSMWETEKNAINSIAVELILPIACDNVLMGIALFSPKSNNRQYTFAEKSFLESAVSIVSIAFKNASLYAEMQNEARRDALTGLYNRSYFLRHVKEDFDISRHDKFSLLLLSLDDFRLFNELYGVAEGDIALRTIADILQKVVAAKGIVSRYGGKEFMVSLPFCDALTAENIAQECRQWLNRYLKSDEHKIRMTLTFCVGICSYPAAASNLDDLLSYTSMAVYSAKKNGKNNTFVYAKQQGLAPASVEEEAQRKRQLSENCASTIYALTAAIDAKDHYTFKHSNNVSKYSALLAEAISLDIEHVEIIRQAGLLHDIGKIGVPESILSKTGRLTDEELEIMKQHVEGSISMIRHLPSLDYVIPAAIGHHERWDGTGYPRRISGENIPIGARCLCLADAFDAMTSERSYRKALPVETAIAEIERNLGLQFDPVLGKKFIELVKNGTIRVEK